MDGEEGSGIRLSKRFAGGKVTGGSLEVDYKTKAGTAWSHSYLNQKPWHPLSYPNQRRKWIAEQTHAQRDRRAEEVAREFAQEQEFFRQTGLISKKDREKVEMMKAVSFMYVRPPGYNAESAKAAEIVDEMKKEEQNTSSQDPMVDGSSGAVPTDSMPRKDRTGEERKKPRPKDVFGRPLPTEEEFEILKNAPRLETGVPARVKPFGVEVRNVKCLRCGNYGHQSGDRECPLKDAIMPNEEVRLKRDDPLTAIIAHTDPSEPLKWELKQKPGLSPPRGGFKLDDPNQQIVAEDIFDEYGGFLGEGNIPIELLTNISSDKPKKRKSKKNKKNKKQSSQAPDDDDGSSSASGGRERRESKKSKKHKKKKNRYYSDSQSSEDSEPDSYARSRGHKHSDPSETFISETCYRGNSGRRVHSYSSEEEYGKHLKHGKCMDKPSGSSEGSDSSRDHKSKRRRSRSAYSSEDYYDSHQRNIKREHKHSHVCERHCMDERKHKFNELKSEKCHRIKKKHKYDDPEPERHRRSEKREQKHSYRYEDSDSGIHRRGRKSGRKDSYQSEDYSDRYRRSKKNAHEDSDSPDDSDSNHGSAKQKRKHDYLSEEESDRHQRSKTNSRRRHTRSR